MASTKQLQVVPLSGYKPRWRGLRAALRPLMFLSRIWGLTPCTIGPDGPPKAVRLLYPLCFFVALLLTQSYAVLSKYRLVKNGAVHDAVVLGLIVSNRLYSLTHYVLLYIHRYTAISAIKSLIVLDDEWHPKNGERVASIIVWIELVSLAFCIFAELCFVFHLLRVKNPWFELVLNMWEGISIHCCLALLLLQWSNLVLSLAYHMDSLIEGLSNLYLDSTPTIHEMPAKDHRIFLLFENDVGQGRSKKSELSVSSTNIVSLRRLHRNIHSILQGLQTVYGGSILLGIAHCTSNCVMALFSFKYVVYFPSVLWLIWSLAAASFMVTPCQMLLDKTQTCADILHDTMQKDISAEDREQLLDFSVQLLDLPLRCTTCNLFQLDHSALLSLLGTIATYVIILVEFDKSRSQNNACVANMTNCVGDHLEL